MGNTLYYNNPIDTTREASMFNQLWFDKAISMLSKKMGLLYYFVGKPQTSKTGSPNAVSFPRLKTDVGGDKIELTLRGRNHTVPKVSNGAQEIAAVTPHYDADMKGAATFGWAHYADKVMIPSSDYNQARGKESKTSDIVADYFDETMESMEQTVATDINVVEGSASDPGGAVGDIMGSIWYAIDDDNTYGLIDRSQTANANFRGIVDDTGGTLTLARIAQWSNKAALNGANLRVGTAGESVYNIIEQEVTLFSHQEYDPELVAIGATNVMHRGVAYVLDAFAPAGYLGIFDPETWGMWQRMIDFNTGGIFKDPLANASHAFQYEGFLQLLCAQPRKNVRLKGLTA